MADLTNELVWSYSRARAFSGCARAYWLQYYGSWGGWEPTAPRRAREAYVQKKLTSRPMWIGTVVHRVAEGVLKAAMAGDRPPSAEVATERAARGARADVAGSRTGDWLERPSRRVGFREHYYGEKVEEAAWDEAIGEIERQVQGLFAHRIFRRLLAVAPRIREVEALRRFRVGDADVYAVLDVMVDDGKGGVVIIDWKTGKAHADEEVAAQLGVYGLYATLELGVPADRIRAMHVNLRSDAETMHEVGPAQMEAARTLIVESVGEMRGRLRDVSRNIAVEEDYPMLPAGDRTCRVCVYRRSCDREI